MDANSRRKQSLQPYYSPDRTTIMERVNAPEPKKDNSRLKRSVLRIMDRLLNMRDNEASGVQRADPGTIPLRPDELEVPSLDEGAPFSTSKSITYEYIQTRFLRSIEYARANQDEDEVLRLERLLTLMENGEVHPVQAARHAWLNPAFREYLMEKK